MKFGLAALVVAASVSGGSWAPVAAQNSGLISGRVVDAATGRPLEGAVVSLSTRDGSGRQVVEMAESTVNGAFEFKGLSSGQYDLSAERSPRYLSVNHGQKRVGGPGVPIALGSAQQLTSLIIAMPLAGVISGIVTDERGEPAHGAALQVRRLRWISGRRVATNAGAGIIDDRGWFRASGLWPGQYVVTVYPPPSPLTKVPPTPVYYPGTIEPARAQEITLGVSEEKAGVDFRLTRTALASVSGVVTWSTSLPAQNLRVSLFEVDRSPIGFEGGSYTTGDGRFTIGSVLPGRYRLAITARLPGEQPKYEWAFQDVVINGDNVTDLRITLQPGVSLTGRVSGEKLKTPLTFPMPVYLERAAYVVGQELPRFQTSSDGRFSLESIPAGSYWIRTELPPGTWITSISAGGREILGVPLDLAVERPAAGDVSITVSDRPTVLSGRLIDSTGQATSDYFVIAFPTDEKYWLANSPRIRTTRPATDGTYTFRGLPPGSYRVAALGDADPDEWTAPPFLRQLVPASATATLTDGEQRTLDLRIK